MPSLSNAFKRKDRRAALIPFVTAGFPTADSTVGMMQALAAAGADVIELGVPFSDPMADGPAIQRANEKALANGMTLRRILDQVRQFREENRQTPVVLMGYANSFLRMTPPGFADAAAEAGVDGVIVVDLSDSQRADWKTILAAQNIDLVSLVAPTTDDERLRTIADSATGFLYFISLRGVTGAGHLDVAAIADSLKTIRARTTTPLAVGFGVRTAEQAAALAECADGVVIGSRLVEIAEAHPEEAVARVSGFVAEIGRALDGGKAS